MSTVRLQSSVDTSFYRMLGANKESALLGCFTMRGPTVSQRMAAGKALRKSAPPRIACDLWTNGQPSRSRRDSRAAKRYARAKAGAIATTACLRAHLPSCAGRQRSWQAIYRHCRYPVFELRRAAICMSAISASTPPPNAIWYSRSTILAKSMPVPGSGISSGLPPAPPLLRSPWEPTRCSPRTSPVNAFALTENTSSVMPRWDIWKSGISGSTSAPYLTA